jgi:alanyl-tRNA synthetase
VERTGRLGAIRLGRIERVRAALRVELFAGDRVLAEAERLAGILAALSEKTGAGVDDLPTWADATLAELRARKRECADLAERAAGFEAAALAARAEAIGGRRLVACAPSERDAKALKLLATAIRRAPGTIAIVGAAQAGKAALVVARAADLDLDVRPILKRAAEELGARGGGTADLAQCGGGDPTRLEAAIAFAAALARSALAEVGP